MGCMVCHQKFSPSDEPVKWKPFTNYDEVLELHPYCYALVSTAFNTRPSAERKIWLYGLLKRISVAVIVVCMVACAVAAYSEETAEPKVEQSKGCVFVGWFNLAGFPEKKLFVKVTGDEDDYEDDEGRAQVHGYDPLNVHKNSKGVYVPERHPEEWFVGRGKFKGVTVKNGRSGIVKCPAW